MNYKSDITKSKFLSNVESDGQTFHYKVQNLIKLVIILQVFSTKELNLAQLLITLAQNNF